MQNMSAREPPAPWLKAARAYLTVIGFGNLLWEIAQFPLYTIWTEGSRSHFALALVHGTGGDLFISAATLMTSLVAFGDKTWPAQAFWRVGIPIIAMGLGYTIYSEWINVEIRHTWAYSDLMPRLPLLGTGLSPLLQWIVVPTLALFAARRTAGR